MTKIIPRNTTLPTTKSETFSTPVDAQTSVEINVLQGEREFVRDNKSLGSFRLEGIPPAPRGIPQIEVRFDIDANGILSVSAADKGTGRKQDIKITGASTLPKDEVERMVRDAERFAAEDRERRERVDVRNEGESFAYRGEKQLKELREKVPVDMREKVEERIRELRSALGASDSAEVDVGRIKAAMEALQQELMKVSTLITCYEQLW